MSEFTNQEITELTPEISKKLDILAQKGNQLEQARRYDEAVQVWQQGLSLIPEPHNFYSEALWFLTAIGDVYFQQGKFAEAHACLDQARGNLSGQGYGNPFVMLRLGECCLETGDEKNALEYLLRAYMFEGEEIFKREPEKYFEFLRTHIDLHEE